MVCIPQEVRMISKSNSMELTFQNLDIILNVRLKTFKSERDSYYV